MIKITTQEPLYRNKLFFFYQQIHFVTSPPQTIDCGRLLQRDRTLFFFFLPHFELLHRQRPFTQSRTVFFVFVMRMSLFLFLFHWTISLLIEDVFFQETRHPVLKVNRTLV